MAELLISVVWVWWVFVVERLVLLKNLFSYSSSKSYGVNSMASLLSKLWFTLSPWSGLNEVTPVFWLSLLLS